VADLVRPVYAYEGEYEQINATKDIQWECAVWRHVNLSHHQMTLGLEPSIS
jgi:hypothetical protein